MPLLTPGKITALKILGVVTLISIVSIIWVYKGPKFDLLGLGGGLSPARDLRGTWVTPLTGRGFELVGDFDTGDAHTTVKETGDMEMIITDMDGNIARGTLTMINVCASGVANSKIAGRIVIPETCFGDIGPMPVEIKVSSSHLDFGTVSDGSAFAATMNGNFTTDFITGQMGVVYMPYGQVVGTFHLSRK